MAMTDVRGERFEDIKQKLMQEFYQSARDRRAALVVIDENVPEVWPLLVPGYRPAGRLVPEGDERTFMPRIAMQTRPMLLFRPDP